MNRIVDVKPLKDLKVWLKFSDGVEGTVDLSDIAGKGVFSSWNDPDMFKSVSINPENHTISWPGGIDLCPDTLYAEIAGIDIFSKALHA